VVYNIDVGSYLFQAREESVLRLRLIVSACWTSAVALLPLLWAQGGNRSGCAYQADGPPTQLGPGSRDDGDYSFRYVSDYEQHAQILRRRICNNSKRKVRFEWPIASLMGKCAPQGMLSEETPYFENPANAAGALHYDFRQLQTRAYEYRPASSQIAPPKKLISIISGYVEAGANLAPVRIELTSAHAGDRFVYTLANRSKNRAQVYWKEFSGYWQERYRDQYQREFQQNMQKKLIAGNAALRMLVLSAESESVWTFQLAGRPELRSSALEIFGLESKEVDLAGVAPLYLPTQ
jgi:hypothetical protein